MQHILLYLRKQATWSTFCQSGVWFHKLYIDLHSAKEADLLDCWYWNELYGRERSVLLFALCANYLMLNFSFNFVVLYVFLLVTGLRLAFNYITQVMHDYSIYALQIFLLKIYMTTISIVLYPNNNNKTVSMKKFLYYPSGMLWSMWCFQWPYSSVINFKLRKLCIV